MGKHPFTYCPHCGQYLYDDKQPESEDDPQVSDLVGSDDWEDCTLYHAEKVLWKKEGSWMGPMPLELCIWPAFAKYVFVRRKKASEG
jgi:hypothetical protein